MRLARALAANGQTSEALGRARHAVRLAQGQTLAEAQLILGSILSARGDLPNALVAFDAAVAQAPALPEAHVARGLALLGLGRLEEADEAISRGEQLGAPVDAIAAALTELARSVDARDDPALATAIALRAEALSARESIPKP
jgi:tetratricopeptide (TPR) repeat protein